MSEDESAADKYRESAQLLSQVPVAFDLAWTRLLFGEWLRRRRRRAEARAELREAYDVFASCGAVPFAERAQAELLATGEHARKRTVQASSGLTPQERQVAVLAASGATNTEIATRLYITISTVEFHLTNVFRKLGLTSRRQIASALQLGGAARQAGVIALEC
jgi:DNA-binding CsgD family transcriptional regulator